MAYYAAAREPYERRIAAVQCGDREAWAQDLRAHRLEVEHHRDVRLPRWRAARIDTTPRMMLP